MQAMPLRRCQTVRTSNPDEPLERWQAAEQDDLRSSAR
jgi:hypothetical protein